MKNFHYVYILIDVATETHRYTGVTEDLTARLAKHNAVPGQAKIPQYTLTKYNIHPASGHFVSYWIANGRFCKGSVPHTGR